MKICTCTTTAASVVLFGGRKVSSNIIHSADFAFLLDL